MVGDVPFRILEVLVALLETVPKGNFMRDELLLVSFFCLKLFYHAYRKCANIFTLAWHHPTPSRPTVKGRDKQKSDTAILDPFHGQNSCIAFLPLTLVLNSVLYTQANVSHGLLQNFVTPPASCCSTSYRKNSRTKTLNLRTK